MTNTEVTGAALLASLIKDNQLPVIANVTQRNESRSPSKESITIYGATEGLSPSLISAVDDIKPFPTLEITRVKANSSLIIKLKCPEAHKFGEPNGISLLTDMLALYEVNIVRTDYNEKAKSPASR